MLLDLPEARREDRGAAGAALPAPEAAPAPMATPGAAPEGSGGAAETPVVDVTRPGPADHPRPDPPPRRNLPWADLMRRVFAIDVLACPACGARLRILAAIQDPDAVRAILDCLGLPSRPPPIAPPARETGGAWHPPRAVGS